MVNGREVVIDIVDVERIFDVRGREIRALQGVDMRLYRGSFVVLMGPSGSGKTTLLNLVGGLDQPTEGSISVDGQRLDSLSASQLTMLRRQIGFIFQSFALMPTASAYENVELAL